MKNENRWLLPEGIEEILPDQAWQIENWRQQFLKIFKTWGYELVYPPLLEYMDSLLIGVGNDLESDTFKLIDQLNGRLLGVRADHTPQVARIEANRIKKSGPVRLCYIGQVLRTKMNHISTTRNPMQLGAELYGHSGIAR